MLKLSFLYGLRAEQWWQLLKENRFAVHPRAWHYAALISLFSLQNSWLARRDRALVTREPEADPIFILGHWRSGTTHLHYLLDADPRHTTCSTYDCAYPWSFLSSAADHGKSLEPLAPKQRPQDSVRFSLWTPQEDELGLTVLCMKSPYLAWAFPRSQERYLKYLTFEDASADERQAFIDALRLFHRKLSHRQPGPVIFKSPGHTARIPLLLEAFSGARFLNIVRNPYRVYQSSIHLYRTWQDSFAFLQPPDYSTLSERVLSLYETMYRSYFAHEHLLPEERTHTLRMEDLESDPIGQLKAAYAGADLGPFPEQTLRAYLKTVRDYAQNEYTPLDPDIKAQVAARWGFVFERYGYAT